MGSRPPVRKTIHADERHGLCKRPSRTIIVSEQVEFLGVGLEATQQAY
jgi:hypothetical protein